MKNEIFDQRLRNAARAMPVPKAPAALVDRVLSERMAGARIALPLDASPRRRVRFRLLAFVATAATLASVAVLASTSRSARHASASAADSVSSTNNLFVGTAYAEQPLAPARAPSLAGLAGAAIRPGTYRYRIQFIDSAGRVTPDGGGSIVVAEDRVNGVAVWRVAHAGESTQSDQRRVVAETLVVTRDDLVPVSRVVSVRPYRRFSEIDIRQRFTRDSVLGEMRTDGGIRRPVARRLPAAFGPFLFDAVAPLYLAGVHLHPGWRASLSIVGWAVVPMDVFYPATLTVVGDERLATPVGIVDCWKLDVVAGRQHHLEWVRKSDGIGLRSYDLVGGPRGHRQYDLLNP